MIDTLAIVFRILLGILFTTTGMLKLPDLHGFYIILLTYNMFPKWLARISAIVLPFAELILGFLLLTGIMPLPVISVTLLFLIQSTLIVCIALIKKQNIENCGCYGTMFVSPVTWKKLVENIVWIVLAVTVLYTAL